MQHQYKVVILAAGRGSRLGPRTQDISKALLPIAFKPVLAHIIEKFAADVECVVALGYKKDDIKDFLKITYPEREFTFVDVDNFDGPGSGPGHSLICCQKIIGDAPFILTTIDTIVKEDVPTPTVDWLGIAAVEKTKSYNSVSVNQGNVVNMQDKMECANTHAFIGLCGINNTRLFWQNLHGDKTLVGGELQLSNGLKALVQSGMRAREFTWYDTGDEINFKSTTRALSPESHDDFDFSKKDEFIYFVNGRVVKYFRNQKISECRVFRAQNSLLGFAPKIEAHHGRLYGYKMLPGRVLYSALDDGIFNNLLDWLFGAFWRRLELSAIEAQNFTTCCRKFYYDKTRERVNLFFKFNGPIDDEYIVNGQKIKTLHSLLEDVPWPTLNQGVAGRYHGDLQFDNILLVSDSTRKPPFVMIDWRQDFGGLVETGDIYYDMAKLYGGMLLSYDLIKRNRFTFAQHGHEIEFKVASRASLRSAATIFKARLLKEGFDFKKVRLLTALIFLNMSPLHEPPFNLLLHHLGKMALQHALNGSDLPLDWQSTKMT